MRYQIYEAKSVKYDAQQRVGIVFSETSKNSNPQTIENQRFAGLPFSERVLTLRNMCGTMGHEMRKNSA